jgi:hypothetical protein
VRWALLVAAFYLPTSQLQDQPETLIEIEGDPVGGAPLPWFSQLVLGMMEMTNGFLKLGTIFSRQVSFV